MTISSHIADNFSSEKVRCGRVDHFYQFRNKRTMVRHRLKDLITESSYTYEAAAQELDTSRGYLNDIANGKRQLPEDILLGVVDLLNVPIWAAFHAPEDIKKEVLEDDEYLLLMNFHKMPENLRGKLIGAVETVMSNNGIQPYTSVDQIKDEKNERT